MFFITVGFKSLQTLSLKDLDKTEELKLRHSLLKYCELDTYAMVKILEKIIKVCIGEKNE